MGGMAAVEGSTTAAEGAGSNPGYSVLMLHTSGVQRHPLGLLTLYQRGGWTVIKPVLAQPAGKDMDADLVAALLLSGLELCVDVAEWEHEHLGDAGSGSIGVPQCARDGRWVQRLEGGRLRTARQPVKQRCLVSGCWSSTTTKASLA